MKNSEKIVKILVIAFFIFLPTFMLFSCNYIIIRILNGYIFYCLSATSVTISGVRVHKDDTIIVSLRGINTFEED